MGERLTFKSVEVRVVAVPLKRPVIAKVGSFKEWPVLLIDLYTQGRLKLDELISGRWSLEQVNEAIADTRTGKARRNVIVFPA